MKTLEERFEKLCVRLDDAVMARKELLEEVATNHKEPLPAEVLFMLALGAYDKEVVLNKIDTYFFCMDKLEKAVKKFAKCLDSGSFECVNNNGVVLYTYTDPSKDIYTSDSDLIEIANFLYIQYDGELDPYVRVN